MRPGGKRACSSLAVQACVRHCRALAPLSTIFGWRKCSNSATKDLQTPGGGFFFFFALRFHLVPVLRGACLIKAARSSASGCTTARGLCYSRTLAVVFSRRDRPSVCNGSQGLQGGAPAPAAVKLHAARA